MPCLRNPFKVGGTIKKPFFFFFHFWAGWHSCSWRRGFNVSGSALLSSAWQSSLVDNVANVCDMPVLVVSLNQCGSWCSLASTVFNSAIPTKSLTVPQGHLASRKALAILHCSSWRMARTLLYIVMGFLLPMFLIYCCCISSLETTYLPCVTEMRVFASTRDFLRSSITFSLVFTRSAYFLAVAVQLLDFSIFSQ